MDKDKLEELIKQKSRLIVEIDLLKAQIEHKATVAASAEMEIAAMHLLSDPNEAVINFVSAGSLYVKAGQLDKAVVAFRAALAATKDKAKLGNTIKEILPDNRWGAVGI